MHTLWWIVVHQLLVYLETDFSIALHLVLSFKAVQCGFQMLPTQNGEVSHPLYTGVDCCTRCGVVMNGPKE